MIQLHNISYKHPDRSSLFNNLNLVVNNSSKAALIGNNGCGKSTILKLVAGNIHAHSGNIFVDKKLYYVPQQYGQFDQLSVSQVLKVDKKLNALRSILSGSIDEEQYALLNEDWLLEERCKKALKLWGIENTLLDQGFSTLSGGQKTKVLLAGIIIHSPEIVLLDEASNHLDKVARKQLYNFVSESSCTFLIVSHDRLLLNLTDTILELSQGRITSYGGNYIFYKKQKAIEANALKQAVLNKQKELKKAREKKTASFERQQKLNARGKRKQLKANMPKSARDKMKNDSENTLSKLKMVHLEKVEGISNELHSLQNTLPNLDSMKFALNNSNLHSGKILIKANDVNFSYSTELLWKKQLNLTITSGDRLAIRGKNGSGKTSLIRLLLGEISPSKGEIHSSYINSLYIDQDYSLISEEHTILQQVQLFNDNNLEEHELKIKLNQFLFPQDSWEKPCNKLSGGERMRLLLCCISIKNNSPDLIVLDEPTNNLDIQNIDILTSAIKEFIGTLLVVSHDDQFLNDVGIENFIDLS